MYVHKLTPLDITERMADAQIDLIDRTDSEDYYKEFVFGRTDIAILQIFDVCNIFFYTSGRMQIDYWSGIQASSDVEDKIREWAEAKFAAVDPDYIRKHREFFERIGNTWALV